jgi:hypothetical protein
MRRHCGAMEVAMPIVRHRDFAVMARRHRT